MTVGPTVWPSRLVSTPCEVSASTSVRPRASTSALLIGLLRRAGEDVRRRQHPLAALGTWPELELGLLGARPDRRRRAEEAGGAPAVLRGFRASSQSSSSAASYRPWASAARPRPGGRSSTSTCCRTRCGPCGRSAPRRRRHPCWCASACFAAMHPSAPARRRCTPRPARRCAPPEAMRLRNGSPTSAPIHPPALPSVSKSAMILSGPRTTCSRPEQRQAQQTPTRSPVGTGACSGPCRRAQPRSAIEGDRHARTGPSPVSHPTTVSTPRPSGPGQIDVDGHAEQNTGGDEADAGKFVLATLDGLTQLGRSLAAA